MRPEEGTEIHPRDLLAVIKNQIKLKFPQIENESENSIDLGVV